VRFYAYEFVLLFRWDVRYGKWRRRTATDLRDYRPYSHDFFSSMSVDHGIYGSDRRPVDDDSPFLNYTPGANDNRPCYGKNGRFGVNSRCHRNIASLQFHDTNLHRL